MDDALQSVSRKTASVEVDTNKGQIPGNPVPLPASSIKGIPPSLLEKVIFYLPRESQLDNNVFFFGVTADSRQRGCKNQSHHDEKSRSRTPVENVIQVAGHSSYFKKVSLNVELFSPETIKIHVRILGKVSMFLYFGIKF